MGTLETEDLSSLQSALSCDYPDAIWEEGEYGYIALTSNNCRVLAWFDRHAQAKPTLRLRTILAKHGELKGLLTNEERHELSATFNSSFLFGRFNSHNVSDLTLDYEIPFIGHLDTNLISSAIDRLSELANAANDMVARKIDRKKQTRERGTRGDDS